MSSCNIQLRFYGYPAPAAILPSSPCTVTNEYPCCFSALRMHGTALTDVWWMSCIKMMAPGWAPATAREQTISLLRSAQSRVSTDHKIDDIPRARSCSKTTPLTAPYGGRKMLGVTPVACLMASLVRSISPAIWSIGSFGNSGCDHE